MDLSVGLPLTGGCPALDLAHQIRTCCSHSLSLSTALWICKTLVGPSAFSCPVPCEGHSLLSSFHFLVAKEKPGKADECTEIHKQEAKYEDRKGRRNLALFLVPVLGHLLPPDLQDTGWGNVPPEALVALESRSSLRRTFLC